MTGPDEKLEQQWRRGLSLLAEEAASAERRPQRRFPLAVAAALAVAVAGAAIGVGTVQSNRDGGTAAGPRATPVTTVGGTPTVGVGVRYDLTRLVRESPRVVVGTVTDVSPGTASEESGGLDYVLATVRVEATLRGPATSTVVAFDYVYGRPGTALEVGARLLLFLADTTGTVHAQLQPPHWQVTGGASGAYPMRVDEPEATFTLEDVREKVRTAG